MKARCDNACLEKILAIERILQKNPNGITMEQILDKLFIEYGIKAERKGVYNNINALTRFMPICLKRISNNHFYYLQRSEEQ